MLRVLPIRLIQYATEDRSAMQAIALAFSVKSRYRSSQYHSFTYSRIAQEYHIGRGKAKRLISVLRQLNLIGDKGQSIIFHKFSSCIDKGKLFEIQPYNNIDLFNLTEIEKYLRLQTVYIKQNQIDYAFNRLQHLHEPTTLKEYRSAKKFARNYSWTGEIDRGQSIATVSRASGLGINNAVDLLRWGEEKKLLVKQKRIQRVPFYSLPEGKCGRATVFTSHGCKFIAQCSVLSFMVL